MLGGCRSVVPAETGYVPSVPMFLCTFNASPTGDNGNVFQALNNVDSTRSAAFAYDPLNRIAQANTITTTGANCWGETYTIDAWGNLTNRAGVTGMSGCSTESLNDAPASTKNQLNGPLYDAAGNVTNDLNGNLPTYDAENRIATDAGFTYSYDADGVRMEKSSGTSGTMYWTGPGGEYLTETDVTGTINEEYVYFNGARIARVDRPSGAVHYYFSDHLGSASAITDASGNVQERYFHYPYGGLASGSGGDPNHYKFTGKERDSESGLDNFGFRYHGSSMGRFMSPDDNSAQDQANPQSWNLYSYVMNRPTIATDPDGHDCIYIDNDSGKMTGFNRGDCDNSTEEKANSGVYVNGTVNSIELNSQDQVTGYSGTGEGFGVFSMGVIQPPGATPPAKVNDPGMIPGMLGPGDLILFSQVKLPSVVTDAVGKVFGSILGKSAEDVGANANKLFHIFGNPAHNLTDLVAKFGSQEAAFKAIQQGTEAAVQQQGLTGVFQTTVQVAGETITVRGNVVGGVVKIGTAFK